MIDPTQTAAGERRAAGHVRRLAARPPRGAAGHVLAERVSGVFRDLVGKRICAARMHLHSSAGAGRRVRRSLAPLRAGRATAWRGVPSTALHDCCGPSDPGGGDNSLAGVARPPRVTWRSRRRPSCGLAIGASLHVSRVVLASPPLTYAPDPTHVPHSPPEHEHRPSSVSNLGSAVGS